MTLPRLHSIAITNFRSISGTITVPLAAPVVLIHGANGAGKTSLLSAIELALSGQVVALRRSDPNYFLHLPHRGSSDSMVALNLSQGIPSVGVSSVSMGVTTRGPQSKPLLDGALGHFFSERCYLAQSTLGRLLEIYQHAEVGDSESPLTKFVKDVLGLDQLDALIDGLTGADDIRRTRKLVPAWRETEDSRNSAQLLVNKLASEIEQLSQRYATLQTDVRRGLAAFPEWAGLGAGASPIPPDAEGTLATDVAEEELVALSRYRREIAGLRADWRAVAATPEAAELANAESQDRVSHEAIERWRRSVGARIEKVVTDLRDVFPDLPSLEATDPTTSLTTATQRVASELDRCSRLIEQDDSDARALAALEQDVDRARARLAVVDSQTAEIAGDAAGLAQALAALLPHLDDQQCPVCGRDFSEVSEEPLTVRLSARLSQLTERAGRLEALSKARAEAAANLTKWERERAVIAQRRLQQDARVALKGRVAELSDAHRSLSTLAKDASAGSSLLRDNAQTRDRLSALRQRSDRSRSTREAVARFCITLGQPEPTSEESIEDTLSRLDSHLTARSTQLSDSQARRKQLLTMYREMRAVETTLNDARARQASHREAVKRSTDVLERAEHSRQDARAIAAAARKARSAIVSRVFSDSLNTVWRDLFVRLAPDEPFVPAFRLPDSLDGPVVAILETIHRSGGRGGAPGAMLSAGNLNTAALTLFLALHLSMSVRLPWLILDDPVQSMDEVHVSQFAALLRTLAKEHGRQILIAVHDRALFDYLALELSPAFEGDQLITVELGRSAGGSTLAEPAYRLWAPDPAVAVS